MNILKVVLCWMGFSAGIALSILALGVLGVRDVFDSSPLGASGNIALVIFGLTALVASLTAFQNRKITFLLYLAAAPIVALCIAYSDLKYSARTPKLAIASPTVSFVLLGYFWSIVHRYHWPYITLGRRSSFRTKISIIAALAILYCAFLLMTSIHLAVSWEFPGDCGYDGTPFVPQRTGRPTFVARVVHVDSVIGAVAVVQERFWGLSRWTRVVFLKWGREGDTYFVDGRVDDGSLTRWPLPVVDMKCTGSSVIEEAKVELRLLKGSTSWKGVRILGKVLRLHTRAEQPGHPPVAGVSILITGAGRTISAFGH